MFFKRSPSLGWWQQPSTTWNIDHLFTKECSSHRWNTCLRKVSVIPKVAVSSSLWWSHSRLAAALQNFWPRLHFQAKDDVETFTFCSVDFDQCIILGTCGRTLPKNLACYRSIRVWFSVNPATDMVEPKPWPLSRWRQVPAKCLKRQGSCSKQLDAGIVMWVTHSCVLQCFCGECCQVWGISGNNFLETVYTNIHSRWHHPQKADGQTSGNALPMTRHHWRRWFRVGCATDIHFQRLIVRDTLYW